MSLFGQTPRRRKRGSSIGRRLSGEREYYYSLVTILVVKIVLFAFLWVLFASSIPVMRVSFRGISQTWRFGLPAFVAGVAFYIGYHIVKSIKEIIRHRKDLSRKI